MKKTLDILQKTAVLLGLIIVFGSVVLSFILGPSINNTLGFILGSTILLFGLFYAKMPKKIQIFLNVVMFIFFVFIAILLGLIIKDGCKNTADFSEDIVVVLGSGIKGEEPAPMLKYRLNSAVSYLQKNPHALVFVAGGQGYGEDISEALAMKRYLISQGVDTKNITKEDKSRNTYENIANVKTMLGDIDYKIVIVTTDFHMFRALQIAQKNGIDAKSYNAPLDWYLRPGSTLREIISILKFWTF